jgi:SAM-dependent methyltransferase
MTDPRAAVTWDPGAYRRAGAFVPRLGRELIELLAPQPDEQVLDLACGDGSLTEILAAGGARVTGVDLSPAMVAAARARGIDARVADGTRLPFEEEFDAVFSNAALHWMHPLDDVLAGVRRSLRTGGRFVAECGGHGNLAAIRVAIAAVLARHGLDAPAPYPWHFPTAGEMAQRLQRHGFAVRSLDYFARPTVLDGPMRDWLGFFARPFIADIDPTRLPAVLDEIVGLLSPCLRDETGTWTADYIRLRFAAIAQ